MPTCACLFAVWAGIRFRGMNSKIGVQASHAVLSHECCGGYFFLDLEIDV